MGPVLSKKMTGVGDQFVYIKRCAHTLNVFVVEQNAGAMVSWVSRCERHLEHTAADWTHFVREVFTVRWRYTDLHAALARLGHIHCNQHIMSCTDRQTCVYDGHYHGRLVRN